MFGSRDTDRVEIEPRESSLSAEITTAVGIIARTRRRKMNFDGRTIAMTPTENAIDQKR
jgi:hypothetical protein